MIRWTQSGTVIGNQSIPYQDFLLGQTAPADLAEIVRPFYVQHVIGAAYFGVIPFTLVLFSLFRCKQSWIVTLLFILGLYAVLSSTGSHLSFAKVNYWLPLFNKVREPRRQLYVYLLESIV